MLSPPLRSSGETRAPIGPTELRLPGGYTPHEFLRTLSDGRRVELERFDTVRPDATVETQAMDFLLELDDRIPRARDAAKLERYDHFLSGWSVQSRRYGKGQVVPRVLFVCRDRARARDCARAADSLLCACRAYAGEYPFDWAYPGREGIVFAAERDAHEGVGAVYGVARLPPAVRVAAAHGDPQAAEAQPQLRELTDQGHLEPSRSQPFTPGLEKVKRSVLRHASV